MSELITDSVKKEIDKWVSKYPEGHEKSAVISALTLVQEQNGGWLSQELMDSVADYLNMPKIAVYEIATFYSMFDLKPVGRHKVKVCTSIACKLLGSDELLEHLEKRLNIKPGETTEDGAITLKHVECLGACVGAPAVQVDNDYFEKVSAEKADALIEKLT